MTDASAYLLGVDSASIALDATKQQIRKIFERNLNTSGPNFLVGEMCDRIDDEYDGKLKLLEAFAKGFSHI